MNIILTNCTTNVGKGQHINKTIWYREEESDDVAKKGYSTCSLMFLLTEGAQYIPYIRIKILAFTAVEYKDLEL